MKYYKGTRRRKTSSKSKISSPGSQNTSNQSVEGEEVSRDESSINSSKSSSTKKDSTIGRKRPSSSLSLTETLSSTRRPKRTKTNHTTAQEESYKNRQANTDKHSDLSNHNELENFKKEKKSQSTKIRSSARSSRGDESSRSNAKSSAAIKSNKRKGDTTKETPRNGTTHKISRSLRTKKSKQTKPKSPESSEKEESVFEEEEEMQHVASRGRTALENNFEISSTGHIGSDGETVISCSEFLQQQVRILKSKFEIEDCPDLAAHLQGTQRQQKNHIPKEIVLKVLRKLNFKVEDELLKSLNRQAQRKILKQVEEIRTSVSATATKTSNEEMRSQEPDGSVEELRKNVEKATTELDGLKRLTDMAAQVESIAEGFSTHPLVEDIKHTNKLIQKLNQKVKKGGFTIENKETLTTKGPLSHQEIVNKLFS